MKILKSEILRAWDKEKNNIKGGTFVHTTEHKDSQARIINKELKVCPIAAILKYRVPGSLYSDLIMYCSDYTQYGLYEHTVKHNIKDADKIRNYAMNKIIKEFDYLSLIGCEYEYLIRDKNMLANDAYVELLKFVEVHIPKQFDATDWYEKKWANWRNKRMLSSKKPIKKTAQKTSVIPVIGIRE